MPTNLPLALDEILEETTETLTSDHVMMPEPRPVALPNMATTSFAFDTTLLPLVMMETFAHRTC